MKRLLFAVILLVTTMLTISANIAQLILRDSTAPTGFNKWRRHQRDRNGIFRGLPHNVVGVLYDI